MCAVIGWAILGIQGLETAPFRVLHVRCFGKPGGGLLFVSRLRFAGNRRRAPAPTELPPPLRGGELSAAAPTAGHVRSRRPSSPIGLCGRYPIVSRTVCRSGHSVKCLRIWLVVSLAGGRGAGTPSPRLGNH